MDTQEGSPSPMDVLERAKVAQHAAELRHGEKARHALEFGLARREKLAEEVAEHDRQLGEFSTAIREAQTAIAAAQERQGPVPELEGALTVLRSGRDLLVARLESARGELAALDKRPDIRAHLEEQAVQEAKRAGHARKTKELAVLEKDMDEALRLEQEIGATARLLTELWKADNGYNLTLTGEGRSGHLVDDRKLVDELTQIQREKQQLAALEGRWFKSGERARLQPHISKESEIQAQRDTLRQRYNNIRGENDRLKDDLEEKLVDLQNVLDKIQQRATDTHFAQARTSGAQDRFWEHGGRARHDPKKPLPTDDLIRQRFPFVRYSGARLTISLSELFKAHGYKR